MKAIRSIFVIAAAAAIGCASPTEETGDESERPGTVASAASANGPWTPFEGFALNNCNGEEIATSGFERFSAHVIEDAAGGFRVVVNGGLLLTGTGLTTGAAYRSNERFSSVENYTPGVVTTFSTTVSGVFVSNDPGGENLNYRFVTHVTVDADGNVRSSVDRFAIVCGE